MNVWCSNDLYINYAISTRIAFISVYGRIYQDVCWRDRQSSSSLVQQAMATWLLHGTRSFDMSGNSVWNSFQMAARDLELTACVP